MLQFKEAQRSHFRGCRLLHVGHDPHRNREARYFALPGEFSLIGYSDSTDSFLIPLSACPHKQVHDAMTKIRAGEDFQFVVAVPRAGRRASLEDEPAPKGRRGSLQ